MEQLLIAISLAYIADLIFGDPRWFPHPVKIIGWMIRKLEIPLQAIQDERLGGAILTSVVVIITWGSVALIIHFASSVHQYLVLFFSVLFIYFSLAIKDLKVESMEVYFALKKGDLELARKKLSMIVSRDTENLDEQEVVRATVETIAENTIDGIISPLFYAFIGGAPLALAYKAVNTIDSMIGYRYGRYKHFGWAGARLDDIVNFIPARISVPFLIVSSLLAGKNGANSFRVVLRDGKKSPSPNSGIPEAAFAGALGVQLGGLNFYNSIPTLKPFIGEKLHTLNVEHIKDSIRISYICSSLFVIGGIFLINFVNYLF